MEYFIKEYRLIKGIQNTAGVKARDDADEIFTRCGIKELTIVNQIGDREYGNLSNKIKEHITINKTWNQACSILKDNDRLFIQFPCIEHSVFLVNTFRILNKRGVKLCFLIHDLEMLRNYRRTDVPFKTRLRCKIEELGVLKLADKIIAHNEKMKKYLLKMGIPASRIVVLGIFDYLANKDKDSEAKKPAQVESWRDPVIIAGNLRRHKAGYAYNLPAHPEFNLYGIGYEGNIKDNIHYFGALTPEDLVYKMQGSFGLVWDGESSDTCSGVFGEYLRINNPHKTSLYLAAGKPVIIWRRAALAPFVIKHHCGIAVDSLFDIAERINRLSAEEYQSMLIETSKVGEKIRNGEFLSHAIKHCR